MRRLIALVVTVAALALPAHAQRPIAPAALATSRGAARTAPAASQASAVKSPRPWMNAKLPTARRAQLLLAAMTPEEKFWQLFMVPGDPVRDNAAFAHGAYGVQLLDLRGAPDRVPSTRAAIAAADAVQLFFVERTRLGIPAILFEEGVHGLMQAGATVFPQAIGLAATWDTALVGEVARAIARQSRERGVRQLLAPVINLARDPRWGRVEETYGEDPWLSSAMGRAYVRALETHGVVATPKHFAVNHGDGGRDSYPITLDATTLADVHLPPFREALRAGARSVMAAYNSINAVPASENAALLTRTLRDAWRFGGVVISDQGGVGGSAVLHHTATGYAASTAQALRAGLDVIFQSRVRDAALFWPAVRDGRVPRAVLDTAVARVLRLKFALGLFEHPYVGSTDAVEPPDAAGYALSVRAAEASVVLLRNARGTLPLPGAMKRIALIGNPAHEVPTGGYSAHPVYTRPLVAELTSRLEGRATVVGVPGPSLRSLTWGGVPGYALAHDSAGRMVPGLLGEYFATPSFDGAPATVRSDVSMDLQWTFNRPARGVGTDWFAVRWTGWLVVPPGERVRVAVECDDGVQLWIDDTLVVDANRKVSYARHVAPMALAPGRHALRLQYRQTTGNGRLHLLWDYDHAMNVRRDDQRIADGVEAARGASVAIVTVAVEEGEFLDRSSLRLPGRQEELITRVAATGTPTVVIMYAGGAVITQPWMEQVAAVLQVFYPGEGGAEALGRVLLGDVSPAGRLPYTVPRAEGQLPLVYDHLPTGRGNDYVDLTGQPLFPFGYGLSYAEFAYRDLTVTPGAIGPRGTAQVRFRVRNTGTRVADEVVQLYVRHVTAPTAQPVLALRAFARITLQPQEEREVQLRVPASALAVRNANGRRSVRTGEVVVFVGASSRDIRLRGTLRTIGARR